jgi:hypothetical protein
MADPALTYARPDVEQLVWATVRDLGGVVTWAYTSGDLMRTPAGWLTAVSVQVDVRARSKHVAFTRADAARQLVCGLAGTSFEGGVIATVENVEGPFWLPDPDGAPRYVARYTLTAHPLPTSVPADRKAVA